ncbi:hypothetical protein BZA77DRAFT_350505 [Pyronema omphalodes]|nr:hypothetical protein BZA77DRAFT_350505 [Pyronema omphalodes]
MAYIQSFCSSAAVSQINACALLASFAAALWFLKEAPWARAALAVCEMALIG